MTAQIFSWNSPLWVVTSYFNPSKYKRRLENFHTFRRFLNAPLLVVELERDGDFQLSQDDGEIVIQLTGEDRIWQKERLINIGIENLPDHVEYVAWVDCDVIFEGEGWVEDVLSMHRAGCSLLQLFGAAIHLPEDFSLQNMTGRDFSNISPVLIETSAATQIHCARGAENIRNGGGRSGLIKGGGRTVYSRGMAWSCPRNLLSVGLYDRNVIGGGDGILFAGASDNYERVNDFQNHSLQHEKDVRAWLRECEKIRLFAKTANATQRLFHLWHGSFENRSYKLRHEILNKHDYCPHRDISLAANGTWQWTNSDSQLAKDVAAYFDTRREDG